MRSFICVTIFIIFLSFAQSVFDLTENDQCSSEFTGDNGVCVEGNKCKEFKTHRDNLKICSFRGKIPLVCCPTIDGRDLVKSGDISVKRISARSKFVDMTVLRFSYRSIQIFHGVRVAAEFKK